MYQRGTQGAQAEVDRKWKVLTSLFLNKWSEVTEESLAAKVRSTALINGVVAPICRWYCDNPHGDVYFGKANSDANVSIYHVLSHAVVAIVIHSLSRLGLFTSSISMLSLDPLL